MFILKFANSVKTGHTPTDLYKYPQTPILRVLHTYTPLPVTTTPSGQKILYSIQVPYLLFDFSYTKVYPVFSSPTVPLSSPLTLTDVVSSPATETCGLSLVSSPHLRADGLLPAATKPAQPRWSKANKKGIVPIIYNTPYTLLFIFCLHSKSILFKQFL